jgi:hypothetical protein
VVTGGEKKGRQKFIDKNIGDVVKDIKDID